MWDNQRTMPSTGSSIMARVYAWMCFALLLTAAVAYWCASTPAVYQAIFNNSWLIFVLFIFQLVLVVALSMFLERMSAVLAVILFIIYALSLGVTLSSIFLVFTQTSIFATFLVTAGMFGAMAAYGYFTNADLTAIGSFGFMALIGLIIGGVVNLFLRSETFQYIISACGVLLFTLLTAYDVQKIKRMSMDLVADGATLTKIALLGALTLYLDFVNLFLYLLQFMGRRRDS
jgi:uncharacterized protein